MSTPKLCLWLGGWFVALGLLTEKPLMSLVNLALGAGFTWLGIRKDAHADAH